MGTNFYWKKKGGEGAHIGKRSAAGLFCWTCNITLCKDGIPGLHRGESSWHKACPKCGAKHVIDKKGFATAAAVELGFSKSRKERPVGVHSCSSFTWGTSPVLVMKAIRSNPFKKVIDEYGRVISGKDFLNMLEANCPIEYYNLIGQEFS